MDCGKRISSLAIGGGGQVDFLEQLMYCLLMLRGTILEVLEADKTAATADCNFSFWWRKSEWSYIYNFSSHSAGCYHAGACYCCVQQIKDAVTSSHIRLIGTLCTHCCTEHNDPRDLNISITRKENPQHGTAFRYVSGGYKIFFLPFASAYYLKLQILMFKIFCNDQICISSATLLYSQQHQQCMIQCKICIFSWLLLNSWYPRYGYQPHSLLH